MRQLIVQVPHGGGQEVLRCARAHDGVNLVCLYGEDGGEVLDVVLVHVNNSRVEGLLDDLERLPRARIALIPHGVMALRPPPGAAPDQVTDVDLRSPVEVFLNGLQSVGSWTGFLGYAAAAGVVVWIGLFTNTVYLLVAAMLIAPFAGPAMNAALATARGDARLLGRSLGRYFAGLGVAVAVGGLLSLVFRQQAATPLMASSGNVSSVAVLLPLVAGAAGALNLVQSERSSLVSGAAVGMLVAASLAPPAGLVGMAAVLGRWDLAAGGLFLLLLQLVGINLAGASVFRLCGLSARGARYRRGRRPVFAGTVIMTVAALAGLLAWQLWETPPLQRESRARQAAAEIQRVVDQDPAVHLVEVEVRFTRPDIAGQNTLLAVVYVQPRTDTTLSSAAIRARLRQAIGQRLRERGFALTPLLQINVLEPP
ncbi:MAG: DUF389 domain-containing protein [Pseudomonadota bacterium]|nr:DUF389 domain-containing protein [Pseudomonadota bacterium]